MMVSLLLAAALVCFLVAIFVERVRFLALGLAFFAAAFLFPRLPGA